MSDAPAMDADQGAPATSPEGIRPHPRLTSWALGLAVVALAVSLFVVWALPVAIAAVATAILALRRGDGPRATAIWALALGVTAILYSVGWLVWGLLRLPDLVP